MTRSAYTRQDFLAARQSLQPLRGEGWLGGFGNMFSKELGEWFGTRRWLWQAIIWLSIINGMLAFVLFVAPLIDPAGMQEGEAATSGGMLALGLNLYFSMAVIAGSIGSIILAQDEIIREKQSGTAAWILSKPVSRPTFVLTKLISNIIGVLVFIVVVPGVTAYIEITLASSSSPTLLPFLAGMGVVWLGLIFYLSLVIMLGVLYQQRGPLLGIAFGLMFGGLIVSSFFPQLSYILPLNLDKISLMVAMGQPLDTMATAQLVSTVILSIVFTAIAVLRFQKEEF